MNDYLDLIRPFIFSKRDKNVLITGFPPIIECRWLVEESAAVYYWRQPVVNRSVSGIFLDTLEGLNFANIDLIIVGPEIRLMAEDKASLNVLMDKCAQAIVFGGLKFSNKEFERKGFVVIPRYTNCHLLFPDHNKWQVVKSSLGWYDFRSFKSKIIRNALRTTAGISFLKKFMPHIYIIQKSEKSCLQKSIEKMVPEGCEFAYLPKSCGNVDKTVIRVMNAKGHAIGYIKIASTSKGIEFIKNEARLLEHLGQFKFEKVIVPSLLGSSKVGNIEVLYQSSVPHKKGSRLNNLLVEALIDICRQTCHAKKLEDTEVYRYISEADITGVYELYPELINIVEASKQYLMDIGSRMITACVNHGDFSPWNVVVTPHGKIYIFDWEDGMVSGLPMFDLIYYIARYMLLDKHINANKIVSLFHGKYLKLFEYYNVRTRIDENIDFQLLIFALTRLAEICEEHSNLTTDKFLKWQVQQLVLLLDHANSYLLTEVTASRDIFYYQGVT